MLHDGPLPQSLKSLPITHSLTGQHVLLANRDSVLGNREPVR